VPYTDWVVPRVGKFLVLGNNKISNTPPFGLRCEQMLADALGGRWG